MKKTIIFLIALVFGVVLTSCSSEASSNTQNVADAPQDVSNTSVSEGIPTAAKAPEQSESTGTISSKREGKSVQEKSTPLEEKITDLEVPKSTVSVVMEEPVAPVSITQQTEDTYDFHAYERWDDLLRANVSSSGKVNYSAIKRDVAKLDSVIKEFQDNYPGSGWSSTQKLTYWINAYNLFTIKLIVDNYPVSSITKITAKPWEKKFIQLGGKTYDLNTIENGIIRKQFNEPRIHFALNCASESCPILLNRAYTPSKLYSQLTTQTKKFLNDASKNDFSDSKNIKISSIFDWYGDDFKKSGTVIDFINKYRSEQLNNPKISYMTYSWDLND